MPPLPRSQNRPGGERRGERTLLHQVPQRQAFCDANDLVFGVGVFASPHPTTATSPPSLSLSGRTIARRGFCSHVQAVS